MALRWHYAKCHYNMCDNAECLCDEGLYAHFAECRGTLKRVASLTVCGVKHEVISTEGMPHKSYLFDGLGEAVGQVPVKHQVDALLLQAQGPFEAVPADGDQHGGRDFALGRVASPCQVVA